MSRHLDHIAPEIIAKIFEIAEQSVVLQEDRVVHDVANTDHLNNLWPDVFMEPAISRLATSLDPNCHSVSLHFCVTDDGFAARTQCCRSEY
jgi:hypothetical protein